MKTAIIYATSRGTTEKAAQQLAECLPGKTDIINLKSSIEINLDDYEAIIVGSSIHMGTMQAKVKKFITTHHDQLLTKRLGLFLCCMREGSEAQLQFDTNYPESLRKHAVANGLFGGEFDFAKMNFIQKFIVKKVGGHTTNVSTFNQGEIKKFAIAFEV
ncbi:flavodoxin domain-containing protein [Desulfuribacillus alkaliarsenatis]|uniref:Flavodoxin n=1 Tax=Desulfuribacillus alkaliarsenatis TaxID=766136 RepID=A0A1E5FYX7_9FIRM|nr:flavodoxin domain-containing protein [Desulfuribacillus alkaliarsenatis]OEF95701.1 flavodoxin [Desulfuribacillus alkaliarsenatis]